MTKRMIWAGVAAVLVVGAYASRSAIRPGSGGDAVAKPALPETTMRVPVFIEEGGSRGERSERVDVPAFAARTGKTVTAESQQLDRAKLREELRQSFEAFVRDAALTSAQKAVVVREVIGLHHSLMELYSTPPVATPSATDDAGRVRAIANGVMRQAKQLNAHAVNRVRENLAEPQRQVFDRRFHGNLVALAAARLFTGKDASAG